MPRGAGIPVDFRRSASWCARTGDGWPILTACQPLQPAQNGAPTGERLPNLWGGTGIACPGSVAFAWWAFPPRSQSAKSEETGNNANIVHSRFGESSAHGQDATSVGDRPAWPESARGDPHRHRQDAGLDRAGQFRLINFAFAERFEPSDGPDCLCGRRRLVGPALRSWTIPASRSISGPRRVFDMGQSSRRVRSASRLSRMPRPVFPPNRPSGSLMVHILFQCTHACQVGDDRWQETANSRISEENRCESQQRNPYRLRSPQEASSCRVDRYFIRREGASQSKMRLYVDFSPQIEWQTLAIEFASRQQ